MADTPQKPGSTWMRGYESAFLVIGIAFLVIGVSFMINESLRGAGFAFFPVGLVFIVLSITSRTAKDPGAGEEPPPPAA